MNQKDFEKLVFGMAHQIRNPSAIIRSNANLLLKNPNLSPEMRRSLEAILNGVKYLESRLDEFIEFSKPLHLNLKPISLSAVLNEIMAYVREMCLLKQTKIACSVDKAMTVLRADREGILLALLNIVLNAIESIKEGGSILLDARESDGKIFITVQDTGCGIHPRDLPEIFSPFYSTKQGGLGIGLAVSKRIIDAHQGKIEVSSRQGLGTRVTVELPA